MVKLLAEEVDQRGRTEGVCLDLSFLRFGGVARWETKTAPEKGRRLASLFAL